MSLINLINGYEDKLKLSSLNELVAQFSGIYLVDHVGNIPTDATYYIDDHAVKYQVIESSTRGNKVVEKIHRAWALPGYLVESVTQTNVDVAIQLPTLPFGTVSTVPRDQILVTTIPKFWYPQVPDGDNLLNYNLRFDVAFLDIKNNRQLFKVAQTNVLDNEVIVLQLSSLPANRINVNSNAALPNVGFI